VPSKTGLLTEKALHKTISLKNMIKSAKRHFYVLCVLPGLGAFGRMPPVSTQELLSVVTESEGPVDIVRALLLSDDLLQREATLSGERDPDPADLAIFSLQQAKGEEPLPHFLKPLREDAGESSDHPISVDPIWQNYFQYASKVARSSRTPFLQSWVGFEVGLRNALARARAEALDLDPAPYVMAQGLGDPAPRFESIISDWTAASNPLESIELLDRVRWNWATEREGWYSFTNDEIAAYTAKIMILHRWRRINQGNEK
jgi:hypothetical protein